jgi:dTDP-4-dehydrorhamnose 3,5-epimerase
MSEIAGVRIVRLKKVVNERGHLMEVQRCDDAHFVGFGQAYVTCTHPGVIKAWYRHHQQCDQIALVRGSATVALFDDRTDSPSLGRTVDYALTDESPGLIQIPPGVWHGFRADGCEPLYFLHLNSVPQHADAPDEDRLSPHDPRVPYEWR